MKTTFLSKAALLFAVFLLLGTSTFRASAQAIIPPGLPDKFLAQPSGYPNSSTIDYTTFCNGGMACTALGLPPQLTAVVTDGGVGGPPVWLYVNDQVSGWVPVPINAPPGSSPDVAVGDDLANPGQYIAAVVVTMGGNVFLFSYSIAGVGVAPGSLTVTPLPICVISSTGNDVGPAHIDIEAQYSTPYWVFPGLPPGLPLSNNFAVTWQDNTAGNGIMGYFASLNAPCAGITQVIDPTPGMSSPDVSAIERSNPGTLPPGAGNEDWAVFSYVRKNTYPTPDELWYTEWRVNPIAPLVIIGPTLYDNTQTYVPTNPSFVSIQRMDAIDDLNNNMPGPGVYPLTPPAANAYFDIAIPVLLTTAPFGAAIWEYNNIDDAVLPGPPIGGDITSPVPGVAGQKNLVPQVACGPGPFYSVAYWSGGSTQGYYATSIDWGTGVPTTDPNAYRVNTLGWAPSPGFPFGIAVSGSCNNNTPGLQQLFAGWENHGAMWDKYSPTVAPYSFKHTPNTTPSIVSTDEWQLSPNPAIDHITLTAPAGFAVNESSAYHITDLSGKTILQNKISNSTEQINVNDLPAGMYMLSIHGSNMNTKTIKFVKE